MQQTLFDLGMNEKTINDISNPETYKGINSFHKYWGKKPTESIIYFIQKFTDESDIVLDPFLGSGFISRECLLRKRRFIGIDINPVAIELSNLILELPNEDEFKASIKTIERNVEKKINQTYITADGNFASHYLWNDGSIKEIWIKNGISKRITQFSPTVFDIEQVQKFSDYSTRNIRKLTFFTNSRINANNQMSIYDLFTHRALYNIDLLLDEINKFPQPLQRALLLSLTSSSGQMSSMVFAITSRGKTKNMVSDRVEVGSWVIGFWRPNLHFEINVWNCFKSRADKLYKAIREIPDYQFVKHQSIDTLLENNQGAFIVNSDCIEVMQKIPEKTIKLVCTDPPHSDRIPYLELSELWNSILNKDVNFENEIIVSNAKERNKSKKDYIKKMESLINESSRILTDDGMLLIYFNARDKQSWKFMEILETNEKLQFLGAFPMEYSANSVVQDNRKGGMKTDYILVLKRNGEVVDFKHELHTIPGWTTSIPKNDI